MTISAVSTGSAASLLALQSTATVSRRDKDGDTDGGNEASESSATKASETRAPLPANGSVGRSVDISA